MEHGPLSNEQFAANINEGGGGSVNFKTREPLTGSGFLTSFAGAEKPTALPIKAEDIATYRSAHHELASKSDATIHGVWKNAATPGIADQDLSVQLKTPKEAQEMGTAEKQKASYALGGTRVSRRGHFAGGYGTDVLLHTADLGKNDVDPRYRPGALDTPGTGSFTRNQYVNKDMKKSPKTPSYVTDADGNKTKITYEHVLRTINENRVNRMRGEG